MKTRLDTVLTGTVNTAKTAADRIMEDEGTTDFTPQFKSESAPEPKTGVAAASDEDDDAMSYFEKLANE